jgi:signal transduction histidine kinase
MNKPYSEEPAMSRRSFDQSDFLNAEWLATLSHELRSPLATIHGYATLLQSYDSKLSPEERKDFLQLITAGSNHLVGLLDMFFAVAQFESGQVTLSPSSIDLVPFIQETLPAVAPEDLSSAHKQRRFDLRKARGFSSDAQSIIIEADRALLRQLLVHLLENAQKFSSEDTTIEIVVSLLDSQQVQSSGLFPGHLLTQLQVLDQPMVELQVQDYGIGIPVEYYERIFDRFQRVNVQLTRAENGLGLGLALCKYIVSLHHGLIWVESISGSGSIFHVLLPLHYR